jgi:hypothetical protein
VTYGRDTDCKVFRHIKVIFWRARRANSSEAEREMREHMLALECVAEFVAVDEPISSRCRSYYFLICRRSKTKGKAGHTAQEIIERLNEWRHVLKDRRDDSPVKRKHPGLRSVTTPCQDAIQNPPRRFYRLIAPSSWLVDPSENFVSINIGDLLISLLVSPLPKPGSTPTLRAAHRAIKIRPRPPVTERCIFLAPP